jgi:putative DNA-invertase from lambdoid prophage Rac
MFYIIGAMAEFERELIRERVKAGLENARRKGKRLGRKPTAPVDKNKIVALFERDSSLSVRKIAKKVGMSTGFVGSVLKEHRVGNASAL